MRKKIRQGLLILGCLDGLVKAGALPTTSYTTTSVSNELLFAGPQTVITAARTEQPITQSPAPITVITAEDLKRHGVVTLLDALRYAVGVNVAEFNANVANIAIRGLTSQVASTVLVLLDNRPLNDQLTGSFFWSSAPVLIS
jgi:outer membrane receptor for ferrienterochelin and colicin